MARTFENPANGHRETIAWTDALGAALFGILYLATKGLWGATFVWLVSAIILLGGLGPAGFVILIPTQILISCAVPAILANRYLHHGWREVIEAQQPSRIEEPDPIERFKARQPTVQPPPDTKACPFCAEEIKATAIRCKHCQADLTGRS